MAWTKIVGPEEAQGELQEVYAGLKARNVDGFPEFVGVYTQEPTILRWLTDTFARPNANYGVTGIDRQLVELIVVAVSAANRCHNCMVLHAQQLQHLTGDKALVDQVMEDYTRAPLDPKTMAALDYATKLTLDATHMTQADVQSLREVGYSDQQIVDIAHVAAWFNYVNRIAEGLGTQLRQ